MGSICSKSSSHTGGHTLVSVASAPSSAQPAGRPQQSRPQQSRPQQPSRSSQNAEARRSQAAAAAERRIQAVSPAHEWGCSQDANDETEFVSGPLGKQAGCQHGQSQIRTARRSFGSVQDGSSCARTEAGRRAYRKLVLSIFGVAFFF